MTRSVNVLTTLVKTTALAVELGEDAVLETDIIHLAYSLNDT